jgi:HEAT repeat protein/serine/threonine protein kinase
MNKRNSRSIKVKVVSTLLALSFFVSQIGFAEPFVGPAGRSPLQLLLDDPSYFQTPSDFVTLKEIHRGTTDTLIIHIQDAHSNFSGQQNLAGALDQLMSRYGVSLVLSEGGWGDCSLDALKKIAPPNVWKRVAKTYLLDAKISGEEYLNLISDHPMKIMGIEDKDLYYQSLEKYAAVSDQRQKAIDYLKRIQSAIQKVKTKLYPQELLDYEKQKALESPNFKALLELAKAKGMDLSTFPNIQKLDLIQSKEKDIPFEQVGLEYKTLLDEIKSKDPQALSSQSALPTQSRLTLSTASYLSQLQNTLNIARNNNLDTNQYTQLLEYHDYLQTLSQIEMEVLLDEFDRLESELYNSRLTTHDSRLLYSIDRFTRLLFSAYQIQMSTKEFNLFTFNDKDFPTVSYLAFINRKLAELGYLEDMVPYETILEDNKEPIQAFYDLVTQRDFAFIKNVEDALERQSQNPPSTISATKKADPSSGGHHRAAFLITGGYHTPHLKELFKQKGWSYVVLTPVVTSETNYEKYEKRLLSPVQPKTQKVEMVAGERKNKIRDGIRAMLARVSPDTLGEIARQAAAKETPQKTVDSLVAGLQSPSQITPEGPGLAGARLGEEEKAVVSKPIPYQIHSDFHRNPNVTQEVLDSINQGVGFAIAQFVHEERGKDVVIRDWLGGGNYKGALAVQFTNSQGQEMISAYKYFRGNENPPKRWLFNDERTDEEFSLELNKKAEKELLAVPTTVKEVVLESKKITIQRQPLGIPLSNLFGGDYLVNQNPEFSKVLMKRMILLISGLLSKKVWVMDPNLGNFLVLQDPLDLNKGRLCLSDFDAVTNLNKKGDDYYFGNSDLKISTSGDQPLYFISHLFQGLNPALVALLQQTASELGSQENPDPFAVFLNKFFGNQNWEEYVRILSYEWSISLSDPAVKAEKEGILDNLIDRESIVQGFMSVINSERKVEIQNTYDLAAYPFLMEYFYFTQTQNIEARVEADQLVLNLTDGSQFIGDTADGRGFLSIPLSSDSIYEVTTNGQLMSIQVRPEYEGSFIAVETFANQFLKSRQIFISNPDIKNLQKILMTQLQHLDFGQRQKAAESLGRIKFPNQKEIEKALLTRLREDENENVRFSAAKALDQISPVSLELARGLLERLNDKDPRIFGTVVSILAKIGSSVIPQLTLDLKDKNPNIRQGAAQALGEVDFTQATQPMIDNAVRELIQVSQKDANELVRRNAKQAFERISDSFTIDLKKVWQEIGQASPEWKGGMTDVFRYRSYAVLVPKESKELSELIEKILQPSFGTVGKDINLYQRAQLYLSQPELTSSLFGVSLFLAQSEIFRVLNPRGERKDLPRLVSTTTTNTLLSKVRKILQVLQDYKDQPEPLARNLTGVLGELKEDLDHREIALVEELFPQTSRNLSDIPVQQWWTLRQKILFSQSLLKTVGDFNKKGIVNRDIKSQNIRIPKQLFNQPNWGAKEITEYPPMVFDFGFATKLKDSENYEFLNQVEQKLPPQFFTPGYFPIRSLATHNASPVRDRFALGVVIAWIFDVNVKEVVVKGGSQAEIDSIIAQAVTDGKISPAIENILRKLIRVNPAELEDLSLDEILGDFGNILLLESPDLLDRPGERLLGSLYSAPVWERTQPVQTQTVRMGPPAPRFGSPHQPSAAESTQAGSRLAELTLEAEKWSLSPVEGVLKISFKDKGIYFNDPYQRRSLELPLDVTEHTFSIQGDQLIIEGKALDFEVPRGPFTELKKYLKVIVGLSEAQSREIRSVIENFQTVLIAQLGHPDFHRRQRAIESLGRTKLSNQKDVEKILLRQSRLDVDEEVRFSAIKTLDQISPVSVELAGGLLGGLTDQDPRIFGMAVSILAKMGPSVIPQLMLALKNRRADIRQAAAQALGEVDFSEATQPTIDTAVKSLEQVSQADSAQLVRSAALQSLKGLPAKSFADLNLEVGNRLFQGARLSTSPAFAEALKTKDINVVADLTTKNQITNSEIEVLLQLLTSQEYDTWRFGIQALGKLGRQAQPYLIDVLNIPVGNPYDYTRIRAIESLGLIGESEPEIAPEIAEILIKAFFDPDSDVAVRAAHFLASLAKENNAVQIVLTKTLMESGDPYIQWNVVRVLSLMGPAANFAVPSLIEAMKNQDLYVRDEATKSFGLIGISAESAIDSLTQAFQANDFYDIDLVGESLVGIGGEPAARALLTQLGSETMEVRRASVRSLGKMALKGFLVEEIVLALTEALRDPHEYVRSDAAQALGTIGAPAKSAIPFLIKALRDENFNVQDASSLALAAIGPSAVLGLLEALKSDDVYTKISVANTLASLSSTPETFTLLAPFVDSLSPLLIENLGNSNNYVKNASMKALIKMGEKVEPELMKTLDNPNDIIRWNVIRTLAGFGKKAKNSVPRLIEVSSKDKSELIRATTSQALWRIGQTSSENQLISQWAQTLLEAARRMNDEVKKAHDEQGGIVSEVYAQALDGLVEKVAQLLKLPEGVVLLAAGSYGRKQQMFGTDFDFIIVVSDDTPITPELENKLDSFRFLFESIDYELNEHVIPYHSFWVKESDYLDAIVSKRLDHIQVKTLLDVRNILDTPKTRRVFDNIKRVFGDTYLDRKSPDFQNYLKIVRNELITLLPDYPDGSFHIKRGVGGLRHISYILWMSRIYKGVLEVGSTFEELVKSGFLSDGEVSQLKGALNFFIKLRGDVNYLEKNFKDDPEKFKKNYVVKEYVKPEERQPGKVYFPNAPTGNPKDDQLAADWWYQMLGIDKNLEVQKNVIQKVWLPLIAERLNYQSVEKLEEEILNHRNNVQTIANRVLGEIETFLNQASSVDRVDLKTTKKEGARLAVGSAGEKALHSLLSPTLRLPLDSARFSSIPEVFRQDPGFENLLVQMIAGNRSFDPKPFMILPETISFISNRGGIVSIVPALGAVGLEFGSTPQQIQQFKVTSIPTAVSRQPLVSTLETSLAAVEKDDESLARFAARVYQKEGGLDVTKTVVLEIFPEDNQGHLISPEEAEMIVVKFKSIESWVGKNVHIRFINSQGLNHSVYGIYSQDVSLLEPGYERVIISVVSKDILARAQSEGIGFVPLEGLGINGSVMPYKAVMIFAVMGARLSGVTEQFSQLMNRLIQNPFESAPQAFKAIKKVDEAKPERYLSLTVKKLTKLTLAKFLEYAKLATQAVIAA